MLVTVAVYVFAKFLEVASLAYLSAGMNTKIATIQKEGRKVFLFCKKVGIDPDFRIDGQFSRHCPKTEWRGSFKVAEIEAI
jgi:hypothetical protein